MLAPARSVTFCLVLLAALLVGCGEAPNALWGTAKNSYNLEFDRVRVRHQGSSLIVEYLKDTLGGVNWACKLVVDSDDLPLADNTSVQADVFVNNVAIDRIARGTRGFPDAHGGKFDLVEYSDQRGGRIDGYFHVVFETGDTLYGNFDRPLEITPTEP